MEGWERPWPTTNCSYNINLRNSEAKFKREKLRVQKEDKALERIYKQNIRKLNAAQRGVISMLGHDPYPNCDREQVLFEYNQPGFCYRRNGQPRIFSSLVESKTRKIVHDLNGKEGLFKKPASNIISDSPVMAKILSQPNIVEILCDLRTTAVLISDPELFNQFAKTLMSSPENPLPFHGENPMDCLVHYRTNLIHEFFDAFRIQMEIRRCTGQTSIPSLHHYLNMSGNDSAGTGAIATPLRPLATTMSAKEWNEAVIQRLQATKLEQDKTKQDQDKLIESFSMKVNTNDDLNLSPSNPFNVLSPSTLIPPLNTAEMVTAVETKVNLVSSVPTVNKFTSTLWPHPLPPAQKPKRNEFDRFVKNLVTEVEKIAEIGKNMGQLQKRKQPCDTVTNPLVRLLKKKSLFSSLTEDDLLFYEYEGGRRDAERRIALGLNITQPRPGGFTFRVPSRCDHGVLTNEMNEERGETMTSKSRSRPRTNMSQNQYFGVMSDVRSMTPKSMLMCTDSTQKCTRSFKRLCCPACNAKLRAKCSDAQERDRRDKKTTEMEHWKMAGLSKDWIKNSSKDTKVHHLLASIPLALRRNYSRYSTNNLGSHTPSSDNGTPSDKSHYSSPIKGQGAPSPAGPRKQLLSKFMSKFQIPSSTRTNGGGSSVFGPSSENSGPGQGRSPASPQSIFSQNDDGVEFDSWTLKVDRMDITRLRHELETELIREKMSHFEKSFLDISTTN